MINRRSFLASILAAGVAPAAVGSGILVLVVFVSYLLGVATMALISINKPDNEQPNTPNEPPGSSQDARSQAG